MTFSSAAFVADVSSPLPTGGVTGTHTATATILAGAAAGTYPIFVRYNGSANNEPATGALAIAGTLTILPRASSTVISSATGNPTTFGQSAALTATVTSTAGSPTGSVTFFNGASALGTAMLSGGTATLNYSLLPVGTHPSISASYAGDGNYTASVSGALSRTVTIAPQTITFGAQTSQTFVPSGTFAISPLATASSGLTPTYSSLSTGVCTVSGTTVTIVTAGSCVIAADQAGNTNFSAAPQVTQTVAIGPAAQTITFGAQASQTFVPSGTFAISPLATASSGLTPTYSSLSTGVCTVSGTTVTIVTAGSCVIAADQVGNTNFSAAPQVTQTVAIGPAAQTITFGAQASQTFSSGGTFAISPLATASSGLTPTYSSLSTGVCTVSGTTVTIVTAGSCVIAADQAGNTNFSAAPQVTQTVAIGPAAQTITFGAQASQTFVPSGTFAISPLATASSGLTPTYSSLSTGVCTVSGTTVTIVTAGSCVIAADQAGNTNFSAAPQVTQTVAIGPAAQTITFGAQASQTFVPSGTFAISPLATASSGLTPTYSSLSTGVCTVSGTTVTIVTAGSCVIAADQAGNTNFSAAPQVTQTVAIGPAAQTITFGAQASQTFVPSGTFAISPLATASSGLTPTYSSLSTGVCTVSGTTVTIVTAGSCVIAADQAGNTNFSAAPQVTQTVAIGPAAQTITFGAQA
ncbi:MAG TPA: Ig-like domain-containing protein, partial [Hyphomicrobiaceae bacterium]|nr:Ig-like domain-containing protein [Hyphomicrobiaceae bacterium]